MYFNLFTGRSSKPLQQKHDKWNRTPRVGFAPQDVWCVKIRYFIPFNIGEIDHVSIQITFVDPRKKRISMRCSFRPPNRYHCCTTSARARGRVELWMVRGRPLAPIKHRCISQRFTHDNFILSCPPAQDDSHHKDHSILRIGDPNQNLHLQPLLGEGTTQTL